MLTQSVINPSFRHLRLQVNANKTIYLRFDSENFTADSSSLNRFRTIESHLYINLLWSVVIFIRYALRIQYTLMRPIYSFLAEVAMLPQAIRTIHSRTVTHACDVWFTCHSFITAH
jgi:hypothetical protein